MKKYSLIFACVAFAVAVALNFSISKEGKMDDMALANVEALAQESGSSGDSCYAGQYNSNAVRALTCSGGCKNYDYVNTNVQKCK